MKQIHGDDTSRIRTTVPLVHRDADAPARGHHESDSGLFERMTARFGDVIVEHAKAGRAIPWALVAALTVCVAGVLAWRYTEAGDDCDPLIVQYVLHQASTGEREAASLELAGHHHTAEAIRALTAVNNQPDDVRLCLLISARKKNQ